MGSFGERLQREREMRGITLEEIANATKIGTRSLRALEEEDFGKLPGGIFNKGFVRAYARYLGINEEQALADYAVALGGDSELSDEATMHRLEPALRAERERLSQDSESDRPNFWTPILVVVIAAICAALVWTLYSRNKMRLGGLGRVASVLKLKRKPHDTIPVAGTASAAVPPAPASAPTPPPVSPATPAAAVTIPQEMAVVVRARQNSWVSVRADGKLVMRDILQAGSETSVHANKQVILTAGNAGGVEISLNGKVLEPIGPVDEVRTVVIDPDGMRPERSRGNAGTAEN